jgi:hypothetical protein
VASGGRLSVSVCSRSAPLRVMCNGRHNLMSKIIRRREDMVGHRCSCMCNGYLQQKGRSVKDSRLKPRRIDAERWSNPGE